MTEHGGEHNPINGAEASPGRARHQDEAWELELAERAHDARQAAGFVDEHGLEHYLSSLNKRYKRRTPVELFAPELYMHARYLTHRYKRIRRALEQLTRPRGSRCKIAVHCAQHDTTWRVALRTACESRTELLREMDEAVRYWSWVRQRQRLPSRWALRLVRYNSRPIAHPWLSISPASLTALGQLDAEVAWQTTEVPRHSNRWNVGS